MNIDQGRAGEAKLHGTNSELAKSRLTGQIHAIPPIRRTLPVQSHKPAKLMTSKPTLSWAVTKFHCRLNARSKIETRHRRGASQNRTSKAHSRCRPLDPRSNARSPAEVPNRQNRQTTRYTVLFRRNGPPHRPLHRVSFLDQK